MKLFYRLGSVFVLGLGIFWISKCSYNRISKEKYAATIAGANYPANAKFIEGKAAGLGGNENDLNHAEAARKTEAISNDTSVDSPDKNGYVYKDPVIAKKMAELRRLSDTLRVRRQNALSRSEIHESVQLNRIIAGKISPYLVQEGLTEEKIREISDIFAAESESAFSRLSGTNDPEQSLIGLQVIRDDAQKQLTALVGKAMAERAALIYNSSACREKIAIPVAAVSREAGAPLTTAAIAELGIVLYRSNVSLGIKSVSPKVLTEAQYERRIENAAKAAALASEFLSPVQILSLEKILSEKYVGGGG